MPERKFDLGDYVEVKDRIAIFYERFGKGSLVTDDVTILTDPDGKQRVMVKALAYRSEDDPHPTVGYSWMEIPGTTSYTRGSELENTETSAWGRAIAALGILVDQSIASAQEVANKAGTDKLPAKRLDAEDLEILGTLKKSGTVAKGGSDRYSAQFFQGPTGHVIGFKLKLDDERDIPQVLVEGELGEALWLATGGEFALGQKVTVKGKLHNVRVEGRRSYYRLVVDQITTDEFILPAPSPLRDPEDVVMDTIAPGQTGFDLVESARLDAEEAAKAG